MAEFFKYQHIVESIVSFAFALPCAVIVHQGREIPRGEIEEVYISHNSNPNHRTVCRLESNTHNDNGNVTTWLEEYHPLFEWKQKDRKHFQKIKVGHKPFSLKDGSQAKAVRTMMEPADGG